MARCDRDIRDRASGSAGELTLQQRRSLSAVEHCSLKLFKQLFFSLYDAFRFFLGARPGSELYISDLHLDNHCVESRKVKACLLEMVLMINPTPPSMHKSWAQDVAEVVRVIDVQYGRDIWFADFARLFAWDQATLKEALVDFAAQRRKIELDVEQEVRTRRVVGRWRTLKLCLGFRERYIRWQNLHISWIMFDWSRYAWRFRKMRIVIARLRSMRLVRCMAKWKQYTQDCLEYGHSSDANSSSDGDKTNPDEELEYQKDLAARLFLWKHPFIKTPEQAFLAGLSCPNHVVGISVENQLEQLPANPGEEIPKRSVLQFVKQNPFIQDAPRPASAPPSRQNTDRVRHTHDDKRLVSAGTPSVDQLALHEGDKSRLWNMSKPENAQRWREFRMHKITFQGERRSPYSGAKRLQLGDEINAVIEIKPAVVHFESFQVTGEYLHQQVTITNISNKARRIRVLPTQTRFFAVFFKNPGKIPPGLSATMRVTFMPGERRSYYDCLRIQTHDKAHQYLLPVHAYPDSQPPEFNESFTAYLPKNLSIYEKVYRTEQHALKVANDLRFNVSQMKKQSQSKKMKKFPRSKWPVSPRFPEFNALQNSLVALEQELFGRPRPVEGLEEQIDKAN